MTTKVIDKNEARVPFFGDRMSFVTGLDPLGLQNPSIMAYSHLLPGLNNVTSRIRNYSFYCWLLNEYARLIQSTDPKEQKKFIRRAEYIIALLSYHMEISGISGVLYAGNRFKEDLTEFNLEEGTYNPDGSTAKTYWQYGFGIFGQYYVGSLRQIGLIEEPVNSKGEHLGIYRRRSDNKNARVSGEDLALAFEANITPAHKTLFFDCIKKGKVNVKQLEALASSFNLTELKENNPETELLITMLLDIDEPAIVSEVPLTMRKETTTHLLKYLNQNINNFNVRSFTKYAYDAKGTYNNEIDSCLSGWYYYQMNEYWQYASTAIFHACLDYLYQQKGPGWMQIQELINECTANIIKFLKKKKKITSSTEFVGSIVNKISDKEEQLNNEITQNKTIERMANSFLLIWKLFPENKNNLNFLREYTHDKGFGSQSDVISYYLKFEDYDNRSLNDFISGYLRHQIINRHQYVAYRKMGGGAQSTQKFIVENNHIRRIGNYEPANTGPRLGSLMNFLRDLKLVTGSNKLTARGIKLLKKLES